MTEEDPPDLEEVETRLREKDVKVLELVSEQVDDVQMVTSATNLSNSEVNYCFRKLEDWKLITVEKPDGMVTRVVDGTKQVFEAPKQAELTEYGAKVVDYVDTEEAGTRFEDLTRNELVRKVHELEQELNELRTEFNSYKKQIYEELKDLDNG